MRLLLATAIVLVASCGSVRIGPVPAACDPTCELPCVGADGDTGVRWAADPNDPDAWDELGGEVRTQLTDKLRQCEVRRKACHQCLQRLERHKVIEL